MTHIKATAHEVRRFGITFSIIAIGLTGFWLYRGNALWVWSLGGALVLLLTGVFGQPILRPVYVGWMTLASALGWLNTRILLGLMFYGVFTPVGVFLRVLGKDVLGRRFHPSAATYWVKRTPTAFDPKRYEQLF